LWGGNPQEERGGIQLRLKKRGIKIKKKRPLGKGVLKGGLREDGGAGSGGTKGGIRRQERKNGENWAKVSGKGSMRKGKKEKA